MSCRCHHRSSGIKASGTAPDAAFVSRVCVLLIKGYQYCISPFFPPCCRYTPTCSQYAVEAVVRYGACKGMWLSFCRILRCHPFARGGYDPVK